MVNFWQTYNAIIRIKLAILRFFPALIKDISRNFFQPSIHQSLKSFAIRLGLAKASIDLITPEEPTIEQFASSPDKPLIFASFCTDAEAPGHAKFNGGVKELNALVKLLRERGYEAYIVTHDGNYEPWLLEHQPHISIADYAQMVKQNQNIRCVSSWAIAKAFIQSSPSLYFWDMELFHTEHEHFSALAKLYRQKIRNTASISRTIQAWHMAHFQRSCVLLPNLIDLDLWFPVPEQQKTLHVGYLNEGPHTETYLNIIENIVCKKGLNLTFQQFKGVESEILAGMRSCEVFLGMNIGKDPLWGEGCPRTVIESFAAGCVVVAFDIIGNRETIQDNFNGILVPRYRPDLMAEALVRIYSLPDELERLRANSLALIKACHTFESRWTAVKEFLHL